METQTKEVQIGKPKLSTAQFMVTGTAPLVMHKFPAKAKKQMEEKQKAGSQAKKGKTREPKDFDACYEEAKHVSREGWVGIPCMAFKAALVSACRLVGFKMTLAKLALFIEPDGFDKEDGVPLVKITKGEPHPIRSAVRNETGVCDIRIRPQWTEWEAQPRITYDEDIFSLTDLANLLARSGLQVGVLEGRPDSPNSVGMGWGTFKIVEERAA